MDRGACQATVHGVPKSRTQLSNLTTTGNALKMWFPGGSGVENLPPNVGDPGLISGLGRFHVL